MLLWVGGFDVLYACQDFEHDRRVGLNSVPQAFGLAAGVLDRAGDACGDAGCCCAGWWCCSGWGRLRCWALAVVAILLLYEHSIISPKDLRRMNAAFFTLNGVISVVFFGFVAADVLMRR